MFAVLALLTFAVPSPAQVADPLTALDRAAIVERVLRARGTELHDYVPPDPAAVARVLGVTPAEGSEIASLLGTSCEGEEQGRWSMSTIRLDGSDALVHAGRVMADGSARRETYRLRRTCSGAGACTWWLVDIRLSDFGSNDVVPLPGSA